jgi:glutaredoxin
MLRGGVEMGKGKSRDLIALLRVLCFAAVILLVIQGVSFTAMFDMTDRSRPSTTQGTPSVELYITSWCPYCQKAIAFFQSRGIQITVYDIEKDEAAARRKTELDRRKGVPFAVINGKQIHGWSEAAYLSALNRR